MSKTPTPEQLANNQSPGARRLFVMAGTDVHPFARLCSWADAWARTHPSDDVLVQHGYTPAPRIARGVVILSPAELNQALADADVAVSHGGPGTIAAIRGSGLQPVVIPRDPTHGEHVDGHQMRFAAWAGRRGLATVVLTVEELDDAVETALGLERGDSGPAVQVDASVRSLGAAILEVMHSGSLRRSVPMLRRRRE